LPRSFAEWRGRLLAEVDTAATPGASARKALASASSEAADLDALLARVREGEIGPWPTHDRARLEAAAQGLRDAASGEGDLEAALDTALGQATRLLYGAQERSRCAERLEETAYLHWRADEIGLATAALRVADELRAADDDDENHAFGRIATERLLAPLLEELRSPGEPQENAAPSKEE
jgi:hypothetical protein